MLKLLWSVAIILIAYCELGNGVIVSSNGFNYYVSPPLKKNWYQALRFCQERGMELVDITSNEENNRIQRIIRNRRHVSDAEPRFWTSGTDNGRENSFYWATSGKPIDGAAFNDWYRVWMQPDNWGGNENCVEIHSGYDWKWNDSTCDSEFYFICREVKKLPLDNCICIEGLKTIY